jgi:DNA-binding transcriptional ArsR family regulator
MKGLMAKPIHDGNCAIQSFDPERVALAKAALLPEKKARLIARGFQALGHPVRLRLLGALHATELCVCDLAKVLKLSVSTVSHHLKELRNAEIVTFRTEGRKAYYSLEKGAWVRYFKDVTHKTSAVRRGQIP